MTIELKGLKVHYEAEGEGIPLLALHGWGVDHRIMSGCMEPVFGRSDFPCRRYYPDLPGMGLTPSRDDIAGSDDMLEYVEAFMDALFSDGPFLLAGESYGGYLSRALVRKLGKRIRGLLLICPSFKPWVPVEARIRTGEVPTRRVIEKDEAFLAELSPEDRRAFDELGVRQTRNAWDLYSRDILPGIRAADRTFLDTKLSGNVPFKIDPDELPAPFEGPTLIVTGRQDSSAGYRGIWSIIENYPRATFAVLDGAGHNAQIERVGVFERLMADWLERVRYEEGRAII